jgi:hypothetical protein
MLAMLIPTGGGACNLDDSAGPNDVAFVDDAAAFMINTLLGCIEALVDSCAGELKRGNWIDPKGDCATIMTLLPTELEHWTGLEYAERFVGTAG